MRNPAGTENEKSEKVSRRKILATMGLTGAAVATGAVLPGFSGQVSANPNQDADQNMYRYAPHLPERTVGDKLREFVSVKDFGAQGDGVTNDTASIQAAVDYAVQNGRREVFFPDGTYKVNAHPEDEASSSKIKAEVDKLKNEDEISESTARDLQMHLTALDHFERQQEPDKVVKHTEGLLLLLDHQKGQEMITDNAYTTLRSQSQALREKWESFDPSNSGGPLDIPSSILLIGDHVIFTSGSYQTVSIAELHDQIGSLYRENDKIIERLEDLIVNVKSFGAKGDGVTDDSQAIKQAIEYVLQLSPGQTDIKKSIFFPTGKYIITKDKLFSDIDLGSLGQPDSPIPGSYRAQGITFIGENRRSSVLHLVTNGIEKWFYDNESIATEKFARLNFEHLRFEADDPTKGHGFKQWSQGWDKQFRYYSCDFSLGKIMQFEGTGNADLNRFLMCNITAYDYAFTFNNAQSVSTELITTETSTRKGLVDVLDKGGGAFHVMGGNHEMHPHPTDTEDHYFIRIAPNAGLNLGNGEFNITDGRFEVHGSNKKLVKTEYSYQGAVINFTRCSFGTVSGGQRIVAEITPSKRLVFDNCMLNENFLYKAYGPWQGSGSPTGAEIYFLNCITGRTAGKNLWERVIVEDNAYRVVANRCTKTFGTKGISGDTQDFDFGWENRLPTSFPATKKIMAIKPGWLGFPLPTGSSESIIKLPNAYITKIYVDKPAIASSGLSYQLFVGSDDKSTILGSSELAPHRERHVIDVDNVGHVDFTTLRLWAEKPRSVKPEERHLLNTFK